MKETKQHPFDELIDQIESMVERFHERITPEDEEEEKAEEHPVIAYQYQKGLLTGFALMRNVMKELESIWSAPAILWMICDWIEAIHEENGTNQTYLMALHASEKDAADIARVAMDHFSKEVEEEEEEEEEEE